MIATPTTWLTINSGKPISHHSGTATITDVATPAVTSGNNLACRMYHLSVAATEGAQSVHCGHLGAGGPCGN